jgi:anthranilate phosphoribosyltransferase
VAGVAADLGAGVERARQSIDSGAAREKLDHLVRAAAEA